MDQADQAFLNSFPFVLAVRTDEHRGEEGILCCEMYGISYLLVSRLCFCVPAPSRIAHRSRLIFIALILPYAPRSYIEQIKTADAAVEKARQEGKAAVEEVQSLLSKESQAWSKERKALNSRLEEVGAVLVLR